MGIDLLVPETAVIVAGMLLQLPEKRVEHLGIARLAGTLGDDEERAAGANMIEVVLLFLVGNDRSVGPHDGVIVAQGIVVEIGTPVSIGGIDHGQQFQTGSIIPFDLALGNAIERRGRRMTGDFALDHPYGQRLVPVEERPAPRAGNGERQQCEACEE